MNKINLDEGEKLHCPFCDHLVFDGISDFSHCPHTVYIASVEGFEYLTDNISLNITKYTSCINEITDALTAKTNDESVKYVLDSVSGMEGYVGFESVK